jgi:hypothetical protein
VALTLVLRHLWTTTGGPRSWSFDGEDEVSIRELLNDLGKCKADPEKRSAVLVATTDDGAIFGAWNRAGAAWLRGVIEARGRLSPEWWNLRNALEVRVTGP